MNDARPPRALVVWCPDWPVTAVGIGAGTPGAVIASGRVAACSAAARAAGVRRGQRLRDAQRHCPGLVLADRDPDAEGRLFERVVTAVTELTPKVETLRPGVCATPVRGPARYYGGEEEYRTRVVDAVTKAGFTCGAGIADGIFAAGLAARAGPGGTVVPPGKTRAFLAAYSTAVLDRPELSGLLDRLGVRTLGDLAALPVGRVAERFGADGAMVHRLARGLDPRPLAPRAPRADLSRTYEFDPPADAGDRVVFAAKALAEELHAGLTARGLTCVRLSVELTWEDGRVLARLWRHDGALSALAVAERVRWQIAGVRGPEVDDEPDAPGGVVLLRLAPDALVPDTGEQQALWGQTSVSGQVGRAAARVQAMLGHHAVVRPVLTGGRGPAERVTRFPVGDLPPAPGGDGPWPAQVPDPAPAIVHPTPIPVTVTDASGAPVTVDHRCEISAPPARVRTSAGESEVTAWTGPWPVQEYWWDPDRARRRARFQAVIADQRAQSREARPMGRGDGRAYLLMLEGGSWYLEAAYG